LRFLPPREYQSTLVGSRCTPCTTSSSTETTARSASPPSTAKAPARVANAIVAWNIVAAHRQLEQIEAEGNPVDPALRQRFSPTLNAHINKLGKFDIDPNRGSLIDDLTNHGDDSSQSRHFY